MEEKDRSIFERLKDVVGAYVFHDPNSQAATAFDRAKKKKTVDDRSFSMFMESAEAGHPFSCFTVGSCYERGESVDKDLGKAYEWYRKAATGGDVNAWLALGRMFDTGTYVDRDPDQAVMWLSRAADKGHPIAMIGMGKKCARGESVDKDPAKALDYFKKAYELDQGIGAYVLGEAIGDGIGCKKDYTRAVELFQEAHDNHFSLGTFNLGMMLEMGLGCEKDEKRGFELIKQAADEGVADAMYRIAFHYREGTSGAARSEETAFGYFKKAADKDFPPACVETGLCYENGVGTKVNKEEAFRYYEKGAKAGLHTAIVCLAVCYRAGIGCEVDENKCRELLEKAVSIGNTRGYYLLGKILMEEDPYDERAMNLLKVSARSGFARAALYLGGFYVQRSDEGPDQEKAGHYYRLAARQGDTTAKFELAEILNTEENKEKPDVQKEVRELYRESADHGHPLAAYKLARMYRSGEMRDTSEERDTTAVDEKRALHYMCIAASGGIPEAAREIAERSFWGDGLQINNKSACALYRLAGEDLLSPALTAKYAYTRIVTLATWLYQNIGLHTASLLPAIKKERERIAEDEKCKEMLGILNELYSQGVPDARIFLTVIRALVLGSDLSSEEEKQDLAFIGSLLPSREKSYVEGLLAAMLHPDTPKMAIDIFLAARKEYDLSNVNMILGNLYLSLARAGRRARSVDVPVVSDDKGTNWVSKKYNTEEDYLRSAREKFLEANQNGETDSKAMYDYCCDRIRSIGRKRLCMIFGSIAALSAVLLLLIYVMGRGNLPGFF